MTVKLTEIEATTLRLIADGCHSFEMIRSRAGGGNGNTVASLSRKKLVMRTGKRTAYIRPTEAGRAILSTEAPASSKEEGEA